MNEYVEVSATGVTHYTNEYGQYHREDGPAVVWPNRKIGWWLNGIVFLCVEDWLEAMPHKPAKEKALLLIKYKK